jgi:MFS family permease
MFTETVYGFGSGIFFWTYTMLAVPSNMLMPRFGAVTWLSCIIARRARAEASLRIHRNSLAARSWGVVASAGVFLQGPKGFYALRLALGISEAGFYPGMS